MMHTKEHWINFYHSGGSPICHCGTVQWKWNEMKMKWKLLFDTDNPSERSEVFRKALGVDWTIILKPNVSVSVSGILSSATLRSGMAPQS